MGNFVGREGSRALVVDEVAAFLLAEDTPGCLCLLGAFGVGKTEAVRQAQREAESKTKGKILVDHDFEPLSPERIANFIADRLHQPAPVIEEGRSRFEPQKQWRQVVDWIDELLTANSVDYSSIVLWLSVSKPDSSHGSLKRLFRAPSAKGRPATRKLILEQQKAYFYEWREPDPFYDREWRLGAFYKPEASEFLDDRLKQILEDPVLREQAKARILDMCGSHPGLLSRLCRLLESRRTSRREESGDEQGRRLVDSISHITVDDEEEISEYVRALLKSLSGRARECLDSLMQGREVDILDEVKDAGLFSENSQIAELIARFFEVLEPVDVFLSYNSKEKLFVRKIADELRCRGLKVWLDERDLTPGHPWQAAIEKVIETVRSSAVLVGKDGLGPWQSEEMRMLLSQKVKRGLPVIPVLLPGCLDASALPLPLQEITYVDLREGELGEDGIDRLKWGVTGRKQPNSSEAA